MPYIVEYQYPVGWTFYAPRVFKRYKEDVKVIDGIEYKALVYTFEPVVKKKVIESVKCVVTRGIEPVITYHVDNVVNPVGLCRIYNNKNKNTKEFHFITEESAMIFCQEWMKNNPGQEFFGFDNENWKDYDDDC
jgi:hypothetical protein